MTDKDKREFAAKMAALSEVFDDGKEISKFKMDVYFKSLERFSIEQISNAISAMITGRVYPSFPKPAEIIQEINGRKEDVAALAWVEVVKTLKHTGTYESVQFADPVIHSAIDAMGGWIKLGDMTEDEEKWKAKEFERLYSIMANRGNHPQYLIGIVERDNGANGYDHERKPVLIGSPGTPAPLRLVGSK